MKPKEILVFGASGQIGRNLIRKLTKNNYKVIAVTRNIHQKGYTLKTQANPGYLEVVELDRINEEKIRELFNNCSIETHIFYCCIALEDHFLLHSSRFVERFNSFLR